ncbi:SDR family oxidoreductase [Pseudoxanthomonas dokdonensis]|uniref:Short-chain dehydrogenase n=1 Tax=Pseudoxanthomonas dokdonensis TaxID=344882 RepID=A0A0R0CFQ2_9GAMM|nr:SDR family oxidoreductase [Pseudoxanthomonas dokdonensis]KRG68601.1 short-chain dehydrogenase [Pseudoxanthomonas dokdonensis]
MRLHGKQVVLTGASGGIGSALCAQLVKRGATVLAVGRSRERLQRLAMQAPSGQVVPVVADLASAEGRQHLREQAQAHTPSSLILAHAQSAFGMFEGQSEADLQRLLETNLTAPMLLLNALLPILQRQPQASVVAIGSTFGSLGFPGFSAYSASKFGLRGLFEALAREYADRPVEFLYLSPRATRTPFNNAAVEALNHELKVAQDDPEVVAASLADAIERGDRRLQIGWPEKLFARINGVLPSLVDGSLRKQLAVVRRHAGTTVADPLSHGEPHHETSPSP